MYEAEKAIFETAFNRILPGMQMFVRDVNLAPQTAAKYTPGIIITEPAFVDASDRVGGMVMSHRFAILSNHIADLRQYEKGTNWGLHVCQSGSFFMVLDVYEYQSRTQISLMHLDENWYLFQNIDYNSFDDVIAMSRERFEKKCLLTPIPELATLRWLERCQSPVGIDDNNEFFPLPKKEPLKPLANG